MSHCAYGGHVTANCSPERILVESPPDRLGRTRRLRICRRALWFAEGRGYVVLGEADR